jgi:hypothetical protein
MPSQGNRALVDPSARFSGDKTHLIDVAKLARNAEFRDVRKKGRPNAIVPVSEPWAVGVRA